MNNKEFIYSLKEGDFITCVDSITNSKLIACLDKIDKHKLLSKECACYSINAKFFVGYTGRFIHGYRYGVFFVINDHTDEVRRANIGETFTLIDLVRRKGFIYDRKTKQLLKR